MIKLFTRLKNYLHKKQSSHDNSLFISKSDPALVEKVPPISNNPYIINLDEFILHYMRCFSKKNILSDDLILLHYVLDLPIENIWDRYVKIADDDSALNVFNTVEEMPGGVQLKFERKVLLMFEREILIIGKEKKLLHELDYCRYTKRRRVA